MNLDDLTNFAASVVDRATSAGADAAEVVVRSGFETSIQVRDGDIEELQEGSPKSVGIRLWRGDRTASVLATDFADAAIDRLIRDGLDLAQITDPIPELALADVDLLATEVPELDLYDPKVSDITAEQKLAMVREAESTALAADERIARSAGAAYGDLVMNRVFATSHGFCHGYRESFVSYHVQVIADDADGKKRNGYWYTFNRHADRLRTPAEVGRVAAERTVRQLGAGPIPTAKLPVVFDPMAGAALIGLLFSVMRGGAVERRSSYLADLLGERIGSDLLHLVDDPLIPGGPASRPFDGEGLPSRKTTFVDGGQLTSFALNSYNARKLGMAPTGHASRPASGRPGESSTNLRLQAGTASPESLIADIEHGLYVTGMMGFGFNPSTGDFSRGAQGFVIENGQLGAPVSEVTVSANFADLFGALDAVANDLPTDRSVAAPTFRIAEMTIGGR